MIFRYIKDILKNIDVLLFVILSYMEAIMWIKINRLQTLNNFLQKCTKDKALGYLFVAIATQSLEVNFQ